MWGDGDLPDEVALAILSLLDYEDLLNVSLVNRRARQLSNDSHLWAALLNPNRRRWRQHKTASSRSPPSEPSREPAPTTDRSSALDERLAFYTRLIANLDARSCRLFLGEKRDQLHYKTALLYMRKQRKQFERFVDDSVGAAYVSPFPSFQTLIVEMLMQNDFLWHLIRHVPADRHAELMTELAHFLPLQQALSFLFYCLDREGPLVNTHDESPSIAFATTWMQIRCRQMVQSTLRPLFTDRSWLQRSYDLTTTDRDELQRNILNTKRACSTILGAMFNSMNQYPMECRLYLQEFISILEEKRQKEGTPWQEREKLSILIEKGFKRVWSAFLTPEDLELLPHGVLDGRAHEKMQTIWQTIDRLIFLYCSPNADHPSWMDKHCFEELRQRFDKYLVSLQTVNPNELNSVGDLLSKRTGRLWEAGRTMDQLDRVIFACLMSKKLKLPERQYKKLTHKQLWDLYGGVQASVQVVSLKRPPKIKSLKADFLELKTAPHCISIMGQDIHLLSEEKDVIGMKWKNRVYPLHANVKHLLFSFLFIRKEDGEPTLKAKAHFRIDRDHILTQKSSTDEATIPLYIEEDKDKKLASVMRIFGQRQQRRLRKSDEAQRLMGELGVKIRYERKFVGRRERFWCADEGMGDLDAENSLTAPHGLFAPFVIL